MKRFYRSSDEKVVAGVCAGLARYFDLNLVGLRWVVALVTLFASGRSAITTRRRLRWLRNELKFGGCDV